MRGKADAFKKLQPFFPRGGFVALKYFHLRQRQVLNDRQMRKKFEVLEHHPHVRAQLGEVGLLIVDFGAVNDNLAFLYRLKTIDGLDQCRFTGAGRAANHHHFAFFHFR